MIPKTIFYLFGLDESFCNKPFEYFHYLNILSAKKINFHYSINLCYYHRPNSIWFDKLEYDSICNLIKLDSLNVEVDGKKLAYTEHLSDILRLKLVNKYGGIYLDIDTICIKPFNSLLNRQFVMGVEGANIGEGDSNVLVGLCNAVLISEVNSKFTNIWIEDYKNNYQVDWNYNSIKRPLQLSYEYPELIHVEPQSSFFKYSWEKHGKNAMFNSNSDISDCFSLHLWEHKNYLHLVKYNREYILRNNDTVSNLYKKFIE